MVVNTNRKSLLLLLIIGFLIINLTSSCASAAPSTTIQLTSNISEDLGEISTYTANFNRTLAVTYTHSGVFIPEGSFLKLFSANKRTPTAVTLSVSSAPDWCTVSISQTNFSMPIGKYLLSENISKTTTITVTADATDIKAKTNSIITIQADAASNGKLPAASQTLDFSLSVDFIPSLDIQIDTDEKQPLSSDEWGNLTLKFNNTSNDKIIVNFNQTTMLENFNILIPEGIVIDSDQTIYRTIPIKTTPLNSTINRTYTIEFKLTYSMLSDTTETGDPIYLTTIRTIQYDPAKEDILDLAPTFIGLATISLLIIIFFSFMKIRQH
jgi:hypothetical protein